MTKNSILRKNYERLNNASIHKLNEPKVVEFFSKENYQQGKILVEVESTVTIMQPLVKINENLQIKSTISGKIKAIEERQNKDATYSLCIEIENEYKKIEPLKKLVKPSMQDLLTRIKEANILELFDSLEEERFCINLKDTKFTLGLNEILIKHFDSSILKGAQLIKKAYNLEKIFIVCDKNKKENLQQLIEKHNLKGLELVTKSVKKTQFLDPQTAIDLYEATNAGVIRTERIVALSGESLKKPGYYIVKIGTPLRELIELSGDLKHTYLEIENYKEDAQMAVFDQIQIKKEIKEEKDKQKKLQLQNLLKNKTEEAQKLIFNNFKQYQQNFKLCLSEMVFLEGKNWYFAKSLSNSVSHTTNAVLFLSNNERKNKLDK